MNKSIAKVLSLVATALLLSTPLSAQGTADSRDTARDFNTHSTVPGNFDVQYVNYQEFRDDSKYHYFFAYMASNLVANQFNDGSDAWAGLIIDADLDGDSDYQLEFSDKNLSESLTSFRAYQKMLGDWRPITSCGGGVYLSSASNDLTGANRFLAFKVAVDCLNLPQNFQFYFYLDANGDGERWGQEWAPDSYFRVSNALLDRTRNFRVMPSVASRTVFSNPAPTDPLPMSSETSLGQQRARGIVQIKCYGTVRHGWVPEGEMPLLLKTAGFQSLVVTTYSSVESCMSERWVVVSAHTGEVTEGLIVNWDAANNLAIVAIAPKLEGLRWQSQAPKTGWAATVLKDIRQINLSSSHTVVTAISTKEMVLSPAITPGSDGLPVFDSQGGVIATMTYRGGLAQNTAVAIPTPLLCSGVLGCQGLQVWKENPPTLPSSLELKLTTTAFSVKSAVWSSSNKKTLMGQVSAIEPISAICTGYYSAKAKAADKSLALKRAKAVCEEIRAATSAIVVKPVSAKAISSGQVNRVQIIAKYTPSY